MPSHRLAAALAACAAALAAAPAVAAAHGPRHHPQPAPPQLRGGTLAGGPGGAPGAIAGVDYRTAGAAGVTDAAGSFRYRDRRRGWPWGGADAVRFSIGDVELGTVDGAALVTPFQLAGDRRCTTSDGVAQELRLLEALDGDRDPSNGIAIPAATRARADRLGRPVRAAALNDAQLAALVRQLTGAALVPDRAAVLDRFWDQVDDERWEERSQQAFSGDLGELAYLSDLLDRGQPLPLEMVERQHGALRSQGVATDGTSWFFSWQFGLMRTRTDAAQTVTARNTLAIPPAIAALGGNHIGDIDLYDGTLYAPIEDGDKPAGQTEYLHPFIALYDAKTLRFTGEAHELPQSLHVEGVPWVAVDGARGLLYTAEWSKTRVLNVFDLRSFRLLRTVPLSETLDRIQGAKVRDGFLYAFADVGESLPLHKIDPVTGHVTTVHHVAIPAGGEGEGLAFLPQADGTLLHTLDVAPLPNTVTMRNLALAQPSLRARACGTL